MFIWHVFCEMQLIFRHRKAVELVDMPSYARSISEDQDIQSLASEIKLMVHGACLE